MRLVLLGWDFKSFLERLLRCKLHELISISIKQIPVQSFKKIDKIGMHSSDTAQLVFEDVRVPAKNLIGEEGSGFIYQMIQFQQERIFGEFQAKSNFIIINHTV